MLYLFLYTFGARILYVEITLPLWSWCAVCCECLCDFLRSFRCFAQFFTLALRCYSGWRVIDSIYQSPCAELLQVWIFNLDHVISVFVHFRRAYIICGDYYPALVVLRRVLRMFVRLLPEISLFCPTFTLALRCYSGWRVIDNIFQSRCAELLQFWRFNLDDGRLHLRHANAVRPECASFVPSGRYAKEAEKYWDL